MNESTEINKYEENNRKVEELKKEFIGLTKEQKELLLYRKIIEKSKFNNNSQICANLNNNQCMDIDELICLIRGAGVAFLKPIILYSMIETQIKVQDFYRESLNHYDRILENYKELAQELGVNSTLNLSHLFTYMLWNGYFSATKEHVYKLFGRLVLPGMYSFDVIKGNGVCLNYAELLHNYLSRCEKNSSILLCKVPTKKGAVSCDYRPEIERHIEHGLGSKIVSSLATCFLGGLIDKTGNHAVTLIEDNEKLCVYDPTNLYALNIQTASTASIINGKGEFQIKPLITSSFIPNADPNNLFEKLLLENVEPALTRKEFMFSFENIMELLNSNIGLLNDSYDNIHSDLEFIDKQTDEIGGYHRVLKKIKNNKNNERSF